MGKTQPLPDKTLLDCTAQAWAYVQRCLPHLLALYDEPYWNPDTGGGLCAHLQGLGWCDAQLPLYFLPIQTPPIAASQIVSPNM